MSSLIRSLYRFFLDTTLRLQAPVLLIARLVWGGLFMFEGCYKLSNVANSATFFAHLGIPAPTFMVYLTGFIQLFGGLLVVIGLFTRIAAVPMITTMIVAVLLDPEAPFIIHEGTGPIETYLAQIPLNFAYIFTVFLLFGAGKWSLDYLLRDKLPTCKHEFPH